MGTGIAAAIPIVIGPESNIWKRIEKKDFSDNFFKNYTVDKEENIYTIKPELLLDNYHSFLEEFYDCIGEKDKIKNIPKVSTYDEFEAAFEHDERGGDVPYLDDDYYIFSTLGCKCKEYWLFYSGSYKAYLETYCTLRHFERTLARALKNPLANSIKLGIYG